MRFFNAFLLFYIFLKFFLIKFQFLCKRKGYLNKYLGIRRFSLANWRKDVWKNIYLKLKNKKLICQINSQIFFQVPNYVQINGQFSSKCQIMSDNGQFFPQVPIMSHNGQFSCKCQIMSHNGQFSCKCQIMSHNGQFSPKCQLCHIMANFVPSVNYVT